MTMRIDIVNDIQKRRSWWETMRSCSGTKADRRNQYWFVAWCFVWAVVFVGSSWALKSDYEFATPTNWIIALIPNLFGIGVVLAYVNFLRRADELIQKIQMEGLALGFGIGLFFGLGYQLLERAGAPPLAVDDMGLVLIGGWVLGQIIAAKRYR